MGSWTNNDGLIVRLGTTEAEVTRGGELDFDGYRVWEFVIDLAHLASGTTLLEDVQDVVIPSGVNIYQIDVLNEVAATSGGSATLNLGLVRQDRSTTYDADGLLAVAPLTDFDTAGELKRYNVGVTGVGALVGTTLANAGVLVADYDTAAFDTGRILVRMYGQVPRPSASNA